MCRLWIDRQNNVFGSVGFCHAVILIGKLGAIVVVIVSPTQFLLLLSGDSFKEFGFFLEDPSFGSGVVASPSFLLFAVGSAGGGFGRGVVGIVEVGAGGSVGC
jgi:hypothetical protein